MTLRPRHKIRGQGSNLHSSILMLCNICCLSHQLYGLVCFTNRNYVEEDEIYLWNPATGDSTELPYAPFEIVESYFCHTVLGFGYNPSADEYKVVRIVSSYLTPNHFYTNDFHTEVGVYTRGTKSWRRVAGIKCKIDFTMLAANVTGSSKMALVNGTLHWMATRLDASRLIISFDIGDEKFNEVLLPDIEGDSILQVVALEGCLSLLCQDFCDEDFEIWVMKDYGIKQFWTKQFSIQWSDTISVSNNLELRPLGIRKNGEILLDKDNHQILLYHPVTRMLRKIWIPGKPYAFDSSTYMESLVSPELDDGNKQK